MPTVTAEVEVETADLLTIDLINELQSRVKRMNKVERMELQMMANAVEVRSLDDQLKYDHIIKVWNKYTSHQIEALLPE